MEIYPYSKGDYPIIEQMYMSIDKFTQKEVPCGYMIEDSKLFLPRGTSVSKLESILGVTAKYIKKSDPIEKMSQQFQNLYDARDKLQEDSINFLLKEPGSQLGLNIGAGFGKAEPYSRRIPTPTVQGWTRMGDLKVGDKVFGRNGYPTKILRIFEQGVQDIYKITFNDGRESLCGKDHLWLVKSYKGGRYRPVKTIDLYNEFCTSVNSYIPRENRLEYFFEKYIPICESVQYPHQDVPIDPYVLGCFIGNGCLTEPALTISSGTEEIPRTIAKIYSWNYKRSSEKCYSYLFYDRLTNKRIHTKEFFKNIPELVGSYSAGKYIPSIYIYNDIETRMKLIRGLMDTDGSISYGEGRYHVSYSSCSKKLLEQIQHILHSFGYRASISPDKRTSKYRRGYHGNLIINIPNKMKRQFFTLSHKYSLAQEAYDVDKRDLYDDLRIKNIKIVKREESRCIMVDAEDHLYLTQDFIVTHNTFVVSYVSTILNEKTIIILPNEGLKQQWINTYHKMFDYRPKHLMNIAGSNVIDGIMNDLIEPRDVYFVNHQTLRSYMTNTNGYALHKFFKKINVGVKVYDEAHMEFGNILLIDFFTNTNRTWYLTATFDRSDKTESACFKRAFSTVIQYGETETKEMMDKHVVYHVVNVNSRPSPKDRARVIGFAGMSSASYGRYAFFEDSNNTIYNTMKIILDKVKEMDGKILIFVPLIEAVNDIVTKIKKDYPEKSVAAYHSKISKDEKESAEKKDIIVTTIKSCGTGKDIKGLRNIICAEPIASKVIAEQMIGRLRPYGEGKQTYFFDIVDTGIPPINWWWNARFKKITTLVKDTIYLNIDG